MTADEAGYKSLGYVGEDAAACYLKRNGCSILARNWHFGKLELDLICEKDGIIIFVEVKTRSHMDYGGAAAAITDRKKRNLSMAAQAWLVKNSKWDRACRFDVICLTGTGTAFTLEYYPDAFDFTPIVDSGNSTW